MSFFLLRSLCGEIQQTGWRGFVQNEELCQLGIELVLGQKCIQYRNFSNRLHPGFRVLGVDDAFTRRIIDGRQLRGDFRMQLLQHLRVGLFGLGRG